MNESVLDRIVCISCAAPLDVREADIRCSCGQAYPRVGRIPVLLPRPHAHVELWRKQLALLTEHSRQARSGLEAEGESPGILPDGQKRVHAMAAAIGDQIGEIIAVVGPAIGGPLAASSGGLPRGVVEYGYYLLRDWGWQNADLDENRDALQAIRAVTGDQPFGRTAVLGAGGCRLAYDLHRLCRADETVVIDIDPYLFVVAEAVVRGASLQLTEASLNVFDAEHISARWALSAPDGPLDDKNFHFMFANGLEPPFLDETFDTIVTPWFIDRVPTDLEAFMGRVRRMLRPGGRWINQGPLSYAMDMPVSRRFAREELFALVQRAGLRLREWSRQSRPYLVSPLTGAGKVEAILTFEAVREA